MPCRCVHLPCRHRKPRTATKWNSKMSTRGLCQPVTTGWQCLHTECASVFLSNKLIHTEETFILAIIFYSFLKCHLKLCQKQLSVKIIYCKKHCRLQKINHKILIPLSDTISFQSEKELLITLVWFWFSVYLFFEQWSWCWDVYERPSEFWIRSRWKETWTEKDQMFARSVYYIS